MTYILAIDQGTSSSRAILFDADMRPAFSSQQEFTQHFPQSGWVEHDGEEIWASVLAVVRGVMQKASCGPADIAAIGITNQRETTLIWDRVTGVPIHNAIVWQDRRTAPFCDSLRAAGHGPEITAKTGLLIDSYFSATKVNWLLEHVPGARVQAQKGALLFGTMDSYLIWKLTEGVSHVTDATNAARTMLYDITKGCWDDEICGLLDIPQCLLPEVRDCASDFGTTGLFGGSIPILGVAGDQQAATIGQACFVPGMLKSTYGTGCFALLNTGDTLVQSQNRMLGTIAYQFDGKPTYALEGSIFIAGAVVQWLRDGLGIIQQASEVADMAASADPTQSLYLVPAFTGLGAPYWDAECRGAVFGLTRNSGPKEFAKAALQSVGYQTRDLLMAMLDDMGAVGPAVLRVDGGMTASDWTMQFLADILGAPVDRPQVLETTALGVAWLAGSRAGIYPDKAGFAKTWALEQRFEPQMPVDTRDTLYAGWKDAVRRALG
ncbi:glycerol kinase GlpK [uncultured Planktomarina sp.]|jgi:glycerol kinase|uniref:glycerol kinase GlpK n=1 Tax=uncultured Planktomarina sp. TaxID=1538529 RepID=UPI00325FFC1C|tara:strand:- start:71 stop:1546 length:1476 start_codon:yes stop_codon:yes gene_type:complete